EIFTSDENYAAQLMFMGSSVFTSFFDINGLGLHGSEMPGEKEGIHGSCLTGYNIGVAKFIPEENIKASVEVVKYFISKYVQKNFFINIFNCFTAMKSLYEDEEVCKILDCELAKKIQIISRPSSLVDDYDGFSNKVVDLVYQFLCLLLVVYEINDQLIANIPIGNGFTKWVKHNRLLFNFIFIFMDALLNLLYLTSPYQVIEKNFEDDNNHKACKFKNAEWNVLESYKDVRNLTIMISMSTPTLILIMILNTIEINNFKFKYLLQTIVTIIYDFSNHFYMFCIKIIISKYFNKMSDVDRLSHKLFQNKSSNLKVDSTMLSTNDNIKSTATYQSTKSSTGSSTSTFKSKMLNIHYATYISET
ncbi:hypothetical protein PIROE2DRAFT_12830, partial [Piromyces sp. E2]